LTMAAGVFEATGHVPERFGNAHASIAPYEVFAARDGLIMICAGNDRLWRALCDAIDRADLADDPRFRTNADRVQQRSALTRGLEGVFAEMTVDDLIRRLEQRSVPCGRVRTVVEALADPQVRARRMLEPVNVPGLGEFRVLANPVKMSAWTPPAPSAPPALGEHTAPVLASLGYTADEVDAILHSSATA
jgi:crotonobetainyl-CoA:carnitine CoA-transferase CaiB-like acyl-CoA transferase